MTQTTFQLNGFDIFRWISFLTSSFGKPNSWLMIFGFFPFTFYCISFLNKAVAVMRSSWTCLEKTFNTKYFFFLQNITGLYSRETVKVAVLNTWRKSVSQLFVTSSPSTIISVAIRSPVKQNTVKKPTIRRRGEDSGQSFCRKRSTRSLSVVRSGSLLSQTMCVPSSSSWISVSSACRCRMCPSAVSSTFTSVMPCCGGGGEKRTVRVVQMCFSACHSGVDAEVGDSPSLGHR